MANQSVAIQGSHPGVFTGMYDIHKYNIPDEYRIRS